MENEKFLYELNYYIVHLESERIVAAKQGEMEKEYFYRNKREHVESIRDRVASGDIDEQLVGEIMGILQEKAEIEKQRDKKENVRVYIYICIALVAIFLWYFRWKNLNL